MNDILDNIQNAILNQLEGATVIPWNNGGIQINVQDTADIAAVIACAADMMDEYGGDDIQITTNQKNFEVFIDICEREDDEDEEEWGEDELPLNERPVPIQKGDVICYRMSIVEVLQVLKNGAWIKGPYGEVQTIDWDDIKQYNPHFTQTEKDEEEVYDYTTGAKVEWEGKPAKVSRTEYIDGNWYMILRDLETEEEISVPLAEFNKIQPKNI